MVSSITKARGVPLNNRNIAKQLRQEITPFFNSQKWNGQNFLVQPVDTRATTEGQVLEQLVQSSASRDINNAQDAKEAQKIQDAYQQFAQAYQTFSQALAPLGIGNLDDYDKRIAFLDKLEAQEQGLADITLRRMLGMSLSELEQAKLTYKDIRKYGDDLFKPLNETKTREIFDGLESYYDDLESTGALTTSLVLRPTPTALSQIQTLTNDPTHAPKQQQLKRWFRNRKYKPGNGEPVVTNKSLVRGNALLKAWYDNKGYVLQPTYNPQTGSYDQNLSWSLDSDRLVIGMEGIAVKDPLQGQPLEQIRPYQWGGIRNIWIRPDQQAINQILQAAGFDETTSTAIEPNLSSVLSNPLRQVEMNLQQMGVFSQAERDAILQLLGDKGKDPVDGPAVIEQMANIDASFLDKLNPLLEESGLSPWQESDIKWQRLYGEFPALKADYSNQHIDDIFFKYLANERGVRLTADEQAQVRQAFSAAKTHHDKFTSRIRQAIVNGLLDKRLALEEDKPFNRNQFELAIAGLSKVSEGEILHALGVTNYKVEAGGSKKGLTGESLPVNVDWQLIAGSDGQIYLDVQLVKDSGTVVTLNGGVGNADSQNPNASSAFGVSLGGQLLHRFDKGHGIEVNANVNGLGNSSSSLLGLSSGWTSPWIDKVGSTINVFGGADVGLTKLSQPLGGQRFGLKVRRPFKPYSRWSAELGYTLHRINGSGDFYNQLSAGIIYQGRDGTVFRIAAGPLLPFGKQKGIGLQTEIEMTYRRDFGRNKRWFFLAKAGLEMRVGYSPQDPLAAYMIPAGGLVNLRAYGYAGVGYWLDKNRQWGLGLGAGFTTFNPLSAGPTIGAGVLVSARSVGFEGLIGVGYDFTKGNAAPLLITG